MCVDGQEAIDKCKDIVDKALHEKDEFTKSIQPIGLCLLDFQMPRKNGI